MDLLPLLTDLGIGGLKERGEEVTGLCALHEVRTGKKDSHPSWSINANTGKFQCFSCGWRGDSLQTLYRDLNTPVPPDLDRQLGLASMEAMRASIFSASGKESSSWTKPVTGPVIDRMLESRHISRSAANFYGVRWAIDDMSWFLPIRTPEGKLIGAQLKGVDSFTNQPPSVEKGKTLFGLDSLLQERPHTVAVVESPLDAVRLYSVGVPAVATFGAMVSKEQIQLLVKHFVLVVTAMDNDDTGERATRYIHRELKKLGVGVMSFNFRTESSPDAKDPGDVENDDELRDAWKQIWSFAS